jgi:hypothetical protein
MLLLIIYEVEAQQPETGWADLEPKTIMVMVIPIAAVVIP